MKTNWVKTAFGNGIVYALLAVGGGFITLVGYEMGRNDGINDCTTYLEHEVGKLADSIKEDSVKED